MHFHQGHRWHQIERGAADMLKHRAAIQSDLDRLEGMDLMNLMKSKKGLIQSPLPGKEATNPEHRVCLFQRKGD